MIYRIYPSKDTTLYEDSARKEQNTGKDEILEIGKFYDTDNTSLLGNSRALIEFDLTSISASLISGDITSPQYRLRAENIESREIESNYDLYVYPIRESWTEGMGSEADTPHNSLNATWVSRSLSDTWDTANATVNRPINPATISALQIYYNFVANVGGFELVDPIKGTGGGSPSLSVDNGVLILSSSNYGGGTANLSASLEADNVYNIDFDLELGSMSGVEFSIYDPNDILLDDSQIVGYNGASLNQSTTYNMAFSASADGIYKIQVTFFDNNGSNGSAATLDNFYVYTEVNNNTIALDQFNINGEIPSTYFLNNQIGTTATAEVVDYKIFMSASNFDGATLNRTYTLQADANYTASFDIDPGTFQALDADGNSLGIDFTILGPNGKIVGEESELDGYVRYFTSSDSGLVRINPEQDGEYLFRWTFFASGSDAVSGSLDNFQIIGSGIDSSSTYTDVRFDAHWISNEGGGTWYTSSFISGSHYKQSFTKYTDNLNVEITDYVDEWIDGTRSNNGLVVKKSQTDEESTTKFGSIKFFSSDTNTIYPPVLETRWDDSVFETGSLEPLTGDDLIVYVKNLSTEYKELSKGKVRVYGRDRFPARTFSSTSNYNLVKYLPTTSYYSVVDADTEQVIIPFDTNYTKLSCDSDGNYFNFWFNGLQPERFYKFVFRVDLNGTTKYYDDNFYFKVVR